MGLDRKDNKTHKMFEDLIRSRISPFEDVPIIFTSVLNKQRIFKVLETAKQVYECRTQRISTSELNDNLLPIVKEQNPPPSVKGKWIKIKYITQLPTPYPQFVFFCNLPQYILRSQHDGRLVDLGRAEGQQYADDTGHTRVDGHLALVSQQEADDLHGIDIDDFLLLLFHLYLFTFI